MRPLRPFCGTVLKAQLLTGPATISTSANGVVTTQLSFLPPASSSATEVLGSSDSRPATVQPPEPAPTTTKSNVSVTRFPRKFLFWHARLAALWGAKLRFCGVYGKSGSTGRFWRLMLSFFALVFAVIKFSKAGLAPFQSRGTLIHTPRTRWLCPGCLLRKPPDGIDRRRIRVGRVRFGSGFRRLCNGLTRGGAAR